jgi:hypothetical protein
MAPVSKQTLDALTSAATRKIGYHEILRVLFSEATQRVQRTAEPNFDELPPIAKTKMVAQLMRSHAEHTARIQTINRQLRQLGLAIDQDRSRGVVLVVDYRRRNDDRAKWKGRQEARMGTLTMLRAQAMIELVDLSRVEAKRYLQELSAKLAKV